MRSKLWSARLGERGPGIEHTEQEPGQPDTLAAAFGSHEIHAVIPVAVAEQGESVGAEHACALDGAAAMFPKSRLIHGDGRSEQTVVLAFGQLRAGNEGDLLVKDFVVARSLHILADCPGQPQHIIRTSGANSQARFSMPPVLHVTL